MAPPALLRLFGILAAGLAATAIGCASSTSSRTPSVPQPPSLPRPSVPSPPSTPQVPTTSPSGEQGEPKGAKAGEQSEKAGKAGDKAEMAGKEGDKAGKEGDKAGGGEKARTETVEGSGDAAEKARGAGGARTPEEERDALDRQLQTSMAEFDGKLLEQQKALEEKQRRDPLPDRTGGGGAGGGASGEGEGGQGEGGARGKDDRTAAEKRADAEAEAAEAQAKAEAEKAGREARAGETGAGGAQTADTGTGSSTDAGKLEGGTPVTAPVEGSGGLGGEGRPAPPDVGDGKDDDVVARQLREAAMAEKDPAIREKLWDEYREYKKGAGTGGS